MPQFSRRSRANLLTADYDLQLLFFVVVETFDCSVISGYRGEVEQNALADADPPRSQLHYPDSNHNVQPSLAVDVVPYPIDWDDIPRFLRFGDFVKDKADYLEVMLTWGGDWTSFKDYPHFEITT